MSVTTALRRLATTLAVAGSLVPGSLVPGSLAPGSLVPGNPAVPAEAAVVAEAAVPEGPDADGAHTVTTARPGADLPALATLRRTWSWPLAPRPAVRAPFVAPRSTWGAGHRGVDLAAAQGQQVLAVDAGVVTHVGVVAGRGTVSVTHDSGLRSTYEPVRGTVAMASTVTEGQVLGRVAGRTHCGGLCLHLGARRGSGYVDPRPLLGGSRVILLPLGAS